MDIKKISKEFKIPNEDLDRICKSYSPERPKQLSREKMYDVLQPLNMKLRLI